PAFGQAKDGTLIVAYWGASNLSARRVDDQAHSISTWVTRSSDEGATWSDPVEIDMSKYSWGCPFGKILNLPDGSMLMAIYGGSPRRADEPGPRAGSGMSSYLFRSIDSGKTWHYHSCPGPDCFNETGLLRVPSGAILAAMRTVGAGALCI